MSLILAGNSGSMTVDSTAGVTFPNGTNPQAAPSKVLQVIQTTLNTVFSTTSSTAVDTGITASITPLFSTSKILVMMSIPYQFSGGSDNGGTFLIVRNSTTIWNGQSATLYAYNSNGANIYNSGVAALQYLDSPATTSSTTYKLQIYTRQSPGVSTVQVASNNAPATITIMEIAQ